MKKKQLTRHILMSLAMSAVIWTPGMAEEITGPITDSHTETFTDSVTVENDKDTEASIKIENKEDAKVLLTTTGEGNNITLESAGSGIRTQGTSTGSIVLDSANHNTINFNRKGNGIDANSAMDISLTAANDNIITSKASEGDGVNAGENNAGKITLTAGRSNVIRVVSDGIYTESGSTNDEEYIAENGNNEITTGNNGIDHRGSGTITLKAENGSNIIHAGQDGEGNAQGGIGDGVRVAGDGTVKLEAKYNEIVSGDEGIYLAEDSTGTVELHSSTGYRDNEGHLIGNFISSKGNGIQADGSGTVSLTAEKGSNVIHVDYAEMKSGDESGNGVYANNSSHVTLQTKDEANGDVQIEVNNEFAAANGLKAEENAEITVDSAKDVRINAYSNGSSANGIWNQNGTIRITTGNDLIIQAGDDKAASAWGINNYPQSGGNGLYISTQGSVSIGAYGTSANGIRTAGEISEIRAKGDINVSATSTGEETYAYNTAEVNSLLEAEGAIRLSITASGDQAGNNDHIAVGAGNNDAGKETKAEITASDVFITADSMDGTGVQGMNVGYFKGTTANDGGNTLVVKATGAKDNSGLLSVKVNSREGYSRGIYTEFATTTLSAKDVEIQSNSGIGDAIGIWASHWDDGITDNKTNIQVMSENSTKIISDNIGILAESEENQDNTTVTLEATKGDNSIYAGELYTINNGIYGTGNAVRAIYGSQVTLTAEDSNGLSGAVYSYGKGADVALNGRTNAVYSTAVIANAGDLNTDEGFAGKSVISALYAEDGAEISVSGTQNVFRTYAEDPKDTNTLERSIWAYNKADIDITGHTVISTDRYAETSAAQKGNSADIAIVAGTATGLTNEIVNAPVADRATVTLNYDDFAGTDGMVYQSSITGDILAAYAGQVDIAAKAGSGAGISVTGNILSGNNGVLNLDLGQGGTLTGRADDYGDAGIVDDSGHGTEFFNPAFSSSIYKGGEVNLTMGEGSRWNVTGQSWITRINTTAAASADSVFAAENPVEVLRHMATIDLTSEFSDLEKGGHALTVYDMKGDAAFNMKLHANRSVSDILYMKHAEGNYIINVVDAVTLADMYAGGFDGLRFATVGAGSNANFRAVTVGQGVFNVEYEVGTDDYATSTENSAYNGESLSEKKPGDSMVENFFGSEGTPGVDETGNEGIQTMALYAEETPDEAVSNDASEPEGPTNYKLIGRADEQTSNAGQTIIDMSKVNYSNAVYMDRLNKRMGEARYIEGDDGLWVRLRHDRIGKDDAFRSMNTMFELGYDWHAKGQKDGEHRQGVAFDYMRGTADYRNVAGDGDVRRAGVWLYDTWMGDKGHYSDYVVKYGRLSNDFDIYSELGEKISGDYDNDVWSVSAEYGRKKDIGNDWYFEPQVQAQYAYVTSADYTTSQGTKVNLDSIDSLIGRAGFRLGRDTSEGNTVYFKADILHEFLGDQSIRAMDATGTLSTTYENEGTWYDVGFGFAHRMGKDSYVFLDVEHSFGNDNDDTYQINIGLNHAF